MLLFLPAASPVLLLRTKWTGCWAYLGHRVWTRTHGVRCDGAEGGERRVLRRVVE